MYLAQSIETAHRQHAGFRDTGYTVLMWKVALNPQGRPVWKIHRDMGTTWAYSNSAVVIRRAYDNARSCLAKNVPRMQDARPDGFVTPRQAERLTGLDRMVALDALTEQVSESPDAPGLQNYVRPPRAKAEKPEPVPETPAEECAKRVAFAQKKLDEWTAAVAHAQEKVKEWRRKLAARRRRHAKLVADESVSPNEVADGSSGSEGAGVAEFW